MNTSATHVLVTSFLSPTLPCGVLLRAPLPLTFNYPRLCFCSTSHVLVICLGSVSKVRHALLSEVAGTQRGIKLKRGSDKGGRGVYVSQYHLPHVIFIASGEFGADCLMHFNLTIQSRCGKTFSRVSMLGNGFTSSHMVLKKRIKDISQRWLLD